MVSKAAQELGKKGGQAKSPKKTAAVRTNAKRPRGKWVTTYAYGVIGADDKLYVGLVTFMSKFSLDFNACNGDQGLRIHDYITEDLLAQKLSSPGALPWKSLEYFVGQQMKVA